MAEGPSTLGWVQTGANAANILGSDLTPEQKAQATRRLGENTALSISTAGISDVVQKIDQQFLGGAINDLRGKLDKINPVTGLVDKALSGVMGMFGNGPTQGTLTREQMRGQIQSLGLTDQDHNLTLASGQKYNIAQNKSREWFDPNGRRPDQTGVNKLNAWDVDYTRDLDGVMNVAGNALSMLLYGSSDAYTGQMANYFTNAAVSEAGTAALTQDSFTASQSNLQAFFKQSGITTKNDANALANQLANEGRISQTQLVSIHQGINLTFDSNGFQAANQLLEGVKLGRKGEDIKKGAPGQKAGQGAGAIAGPTQGAAPIASPNVKISGVRGSQMKQAIDVKEAEATELVDPMEIQNA